jgi:hypothetical protein
MKPDDPIAKYSDAEKIRGDRKICEIIALARRRPGYSDHTAI